jgi:hypothetical protein
MRSERTGEVYSGWNRRNFPPCWRQNRRSYRRYRAPWVDSFVGEDEDDEEHLLVSSARRGVLWGGGAMARLPRQPWGVSPPCFFRGGGERREQVEAWREEEG